MAVVSSIAATPVRPFPPYARSWVDRLTRAVDRLPGPYWAAYWIAGLLFLALLAALYLRAGLPLTSEFVYSNILPFYGFWLIHYLNRRATASLEAFRPAFTGDDDELKALHWRLTVLPPWPTAVVALVTITIAVISSLTWPWTGLPAILANLAYVATVVVLGGLYAYHAIRQLRLATWIYAERARVDLYHLAPLYSFSALSAHTAIGMLLMLSGAVVFTPSGLVGGFLIGLIAFSLLAVLTFLLPLVGLHRRLVEAKERELAENSRRWQVCMNAVYDLVDRGELMSADKVNTTLSALERGRAVIERVPTWPWRPETPRTVLAALVLPVGISVLQALLRAFVT